ncbi:MAG: hypothetical protein BWY31_02787 [Lentisphaerae bacterium ADurb.Bin242]|nr:MAG: hypothetical protein BWY31_02787 [Lentisphaerae bacterium ADurb.Bin242]
MAKPKAKPFPSRSPLYPEAIVSGDHPRGVIRITGGAIATIVRKAACSVEGVTRITGNSIVDNIAEFVGSKKIQDRSIQVEIKESSVAIELAINICYGVSLPEIAANVQKNVSAEIHNLTGLTVERVNVIIREMEDIQEAAEK